MPSTPQKHETHAATMQKKLIARPSFIMNLLLLVVVTQMVSEGYGAQALDTACLRQLTPCLRYLNGSHEPPNTCCDPVKSIINSDLACLCSLISNRGADEAEKAGINITEAQRLPGRCRLRVNPINCLSSPPNSPNSRNSNSNSADVLWSASARMLMAMMVVWIVAVQNLW